LTRRAPVAGTYSLFANYTGANTGTVTLTLHAVPADVSGSILTDGTAAPVDITTPGQNGSLTFSGTATHRMSLKVSAGPSGSVSLRKPDGSEQASVTRRRGGSVHGAATLATTGTYAIKVDPRTRHWHGDPQPL
jgi:hypothetical protein